MKKSVFLLFLFCQVVFANESVLEDFAYGYRIVTDGSAPIYRLPVPDKVYQTTVNNLGDIRIFNSAGHRIPFAISKQKAQEKTETYWVNLPFFPLRGSVEQFTANNLEIRVNDDGRIIDIHYKDDKEVPGSQAVESYIIDLSNVKHNIDELSFIINGGEGGYLKSATIEKSDNLNQWSMLVSNATLSRLNYANHTLEKNNINIPNQKTKYLRFTWRDNSEGLAIQSVRALLTSTSIERQHNWSKVTGKQSETDPNKYEFDLGGNFPVTRVNILLPDQNTLIEAAVKSRKDDKSIWSTHYNGLFYKLNMQGTVQERQPVNISTTSNRYWQLEVKTEDGIGSGMPQLQFSWVPDDIYFLARGSGPYTLAYGSSQVKAPEKPISSLMQVLSDEQQQSMIQIAGLGDEITLTGEPALVPVKEIPWRQIALWIILVSAVIAIGVLAVKLYREMNAMQ